MDYTEIPRSLIFKDRTDLKDFGVQNLGSINNYLFTKMRKLTLLRCGNAKEIALQCFNNTYYICTLIQLDDYPDLCMDKYEKKLLEVKIPFPDDVYQASMALVCVLLAAYDDKYKQTDNPLIDSIHHWTSSNKWVGNNSRKSFDDIIKTCNTDKFILPKGEFAPRDIVEAIETVGKDNPILLELGIEYIIQEIRKLANQEQQRECISIALKELDLNGNNCLNASTRLKELSQELGLESTPSIEDKEINKIEELEKGIAEKDNIISAQKEEIEILKGKVKGLTPEQSALFTYALATYLEFNYSNKKEELGPLASKMFGWGESSMKNKMYSFVKEDANAVALLFEEFDSQFANHIKNVR